MLRRLILFCAVIAAASLSHPPPALSDGDESAAAPRIEVFKTPTCGCCTKWAEHLEANGFRVELTDMKDLTRLKRRKGVPYDSQACHTGVVDGYVIEGHVPAADIKRLLAERPEVTGLVVPGMPLGSPGMEHPDPQPYSVFTFDASGRKAIYSRH